MSCLIHDFLEIPTSRRKFNSLHDDILNFVKWFEINISNIYKKCVAVVSPLALEYIEPIVLKNQTYFDQSLKAQ